MSYCGIVHVWQGHGVQADAMHRVLRGPRGPLFTVAISPDGRSMASGGDDKTIYLLDIASGKLRQTFQGHTHRVYSIVFHPDGKLLASGSGDGTVRLWSLHEVGNGQGRAAAGSLPDQPVAVEGPYAGMNITGIMGATEAQKMALKALGAIEKA